MIREFSVEFSDDDRSHMLAQANGRVFPDAKPGRKTFAFDEKHLTAIAGDSFERFLWSNFDRVEQKGGSIVLANDNGVTFFLPVDKLQDALIRQAIYDYVTGRVAAKH